MMVIYDIWSMAHLHSGYIVVCVPCHLDRESLLKSSQLSCVVHYSLSDQFLVSNYLTCETIWNFDKYSILWHVALCIEHRWYTLQVKALALGNVLSTTVLESMLPLHMYILQESLFSPSCPPAIFLIHYAQLLLYTVS